MRAVSQRVAIGVRGQLAEEHARGEQEVAHLHDADVRQRRRESACHQFLFCERGLRSENQLVIE